MRDPSPMIVKRSLCALTIMLSACGGGGGGGGGGASTPAAPVTSGSTPVPLNTTIPPTTYVANTFQSGYLTDLNTIRGTLGVGLLAQSTSLDTAAQHHADYISHNYVPSTMNGVIDPTTGLLYGHSEDSGYPLFYAATPQARDLLAGFSGSTTEVGANTNAGDSYAGISAVETLMNTVYHRATLLSELLRYIGIGFNTTSTALAGEGWSFADMGQVANPVTFPTGTMVTYPVAGGTDAYPFWMTSWEQPSPPLGVSNTQPLGGSISLQIPANHTIGVTGFTLTDSSGNPVPVYQENPSTDASGNLPGNVAAIIPQAPLALGATYTANFTGTDNGTSLSKNWTFSTPANVITVSTPGPYVLRGGSTLVIQGITPSGWLGFTYSTAPLGLTSKPDGNQGFSLTLAAGGVAVNTPLVITLSDPYYATTPTLPITVTLAP